MINIYGPVPTQIWGDSVEFETKQPTVRQFDRRQDDVLDRLYDLQHELGMVRLCASYSLKHHQYDLSVEFDRLFHSETTQIEELDDWVSRTMIATDRIEQEMLAATAVRKIGFGATRRRRSMDKLTRQLNQLCAIKATHWKLDKGRLVMPVGDGGRRQEIQFARVDCEYMLTSIVLDRPLVTHDARQWREFAILAWQRNAAHDLVTFAFDSRDRLVGQIRHPADHLDLHELECYVATLAAECDRFQYLLSGRDDG